MQGNAINMYADGSMEPDQPMPEGEDPRDDGSERYWADRKADELTAVLTQKEQQYFDSTEAWGVLEATRLMYAQYYGRDPDALGVLDTQQIGFEGEQGELVRLRVNDTRSFIKQLIGLAVNQRPAFQAMAVNTDYASRAQVDSSDAGVSYVYAKTFGEKKERRVVEKGVLFAKGVTWLQWDEDGGEYVNVPLPMQDGSPSPATERVRSGAPAAKQLGWWNVVRDPNVEDEDEHVWAMVREENRSKWEAAAKFEKHAEYIKNVDTHDRFSFAELLGVDSLANPSTDQITIKHFFHDRTEALPEGRYVIVIGERVVHDVPFPYDSLEDILIDFCPYAQIGTAHGYSDAWDLLPVQQVLDQVRSDTATNITTVGRNAVYIEEGVDYDIPSIANGARVFQGKRGQPPPQVVQLASIPDSAKWMIEHMQSVMQALTALNSVMRGDPSSNIKSGTMAALFHSIALENNSPLQAAVDEHRQRVANGMLQIMKRYAKRPYLVQVAGADEAPHLEQFEADKLRGISRVVIKTANPLQRSQAGRFEMFERLMKIPNAITTPEQANTVLNEGLWKPVNQVSMARLRRLQWEREQMLKGINPPVSITDPPEFDLPEHVALLDDPNVRMNPQLKAAIQQHLLDHMTAWRDAPPDFLMALKRLVHPMAMAAMQGGGEPANDNGQPSGEGGAEGGEDDDEEISEETDESAGVPLPKPAESPVKGAQGV